jgi:ssDNA-binding Zn-finger/Zn-ribbon topoisomerase 1
MKDLKSNDKDGFEKSLKAASTPKAMKIKCPNCKREVELDETKLKYHKTGRKVDCPECKKEFLLRRYVRRPE